MARKTWMTIGLLAALGAGSVSVAEGQDLRHPRRMDLPAPAFTMPDTNRYRVILQNGLMGFVVTDRTVPLVTFTAFIRGGAADDRVQGAAEMLATMMETRGPCRLLPGRFRATLDGWAPEYRVVMGPELTEVTLNVAAEDASEALRLFSGIVREPCIDEDGLAAFRRQTTAVARGSDRATGESGPVLYEGSLDDAVRLFETALFDGHPYGQSVTAEDAATLSVEDVERFHRDHVNPLNVTLAVSGDFDRQVMVDEIDQRFADWEPRLAPRLNRAPDVETRSPRSVTTYPIDKLQTWIVIGHELPRMEPREFARLEVMNYILGGGHFDTRLFRETRDKRGLTNDDSGFLVPRLRGPGTYTFRTYGRPEVAQQLIDITLAEIERMRTEEVTEEELFVAKGALADGAFAIRFEDGHATARTLAVEYARYRSFVPLVNYQRWIRDVSTDDVRRAARRYLHPERMHIVTVGPEATRP